MSPRGGPACAGSSPRSNGFHRLVNTSISDQKVISLYCPRSEGMRALISSTARTLVNYRGYLKHQIIASALPPSVGAPLLSTPIVQAFTRVVEGATRMNRADSTPYRRCGSAWSNKTPCSMLWYMPPPRFS